jgi:hypothetical protein
MVGGGSSSQVDALATSYCVHKLRQRSNDRASDDPNKDLALASAQLAPTTKSKHRQVKECCLLIIVIFIFLAFGVRFAYRFLHVRVCTP